jgi:hypothetical protein
VEFTKEPTTTRPGVRICFIRGPHGISIELLERDKKEICLGRAGQPAMQILPDCVPDVIFSLYVRHRSVATIAVDLAR